MSRKGETVAILCLLTVCAIFKDSAKAEERPKTFQRLIPADVLRDFPGVCFASTRCATVEPGETWELTPYCGRSSCVKSDAETKGTFHLFELVEDCGPLPKPNPKCKLAENKFNRTSAFPECCPVFECEAGVKLEYPEIPAEGKPEGTPTTAKPKA